MTESGVIHLFSALYLATVLCLAVSVNENRELGRIARETGRRWLKFVGICFLIGLAVFGLD